LSRLCELRPVPKKASIEAWFGFDGSDFLELKKIGQRGISGAGSNLFEIGRNSQNILGLSTTALGAFRFQLLAQKISQGFRAQEKSPPDFSPVIKISSKFVVTSHYVFSSYVP
jgi:hypothetical protein